MGAAMIVHFAGFTCTTQWSRYASNDRVALTLIDEDGMPVATATCNLGTSQLGDNEIIIKDWSENEGMVDALINADVVDRVVRDDHTGFTSVKVCLLTCEAIDEICADA